MVMALLACCTSVGFTQNSIDAQSQAQSTRPQMARVSAAVMVGLVERKVLPQYPEEALTKGIQGDVVFKIVVDETGKIVRSETVEGDPLLAATSADALRHFLFRPYLLDGTPVTVQSQIGFHFAITQKGDSTEGQVECMSTIP
jgi:TonB family protein